MLKFCYSPFCLVLSIHFLKCLSYAMQNFNKTHLLSSTLQSVVAMTDHSCRRLKKCNPISQLSENMEPKTISLQDLLLSNTSFYSQFLELVKLKPFFLLGGLRNQDSTVHTCNIVLGTFLLQTKMNQCSCQQHTYVFIVP